jgi:long-chain acyl-CoA synthetase
MIKENYIKEYVENALKNFWDYECMTDYGGETLSYGQVAKTIARLHLMFEQCGMQKGDKVALIGKNSTNWAIVYLAAVSYGAVIVPILSDFHPNDIHHIVNHSDAVALFISDNLWDNVDESKMPNVRVIISLKDFSILIESNKDAIQKIYDNLKTLYRQKYPDHLRPELINYGDIPNDALGVLSYTSGTTGFSKGVMLPLNSLSANVRFARKSMHLEPKDNIVSFLPLAHAFGCAFDFLFPFSMGAHIHFLTRVPTPQIILNAFKEIKPAVIFSVPLIMEKIYKKQLLPVIRKSGIKVAMNIPVLNSYIKGQIRNKLQTAFGEKFDQVILGGAPLNNEVDLFLKRIGFNYTVGYGMTECGPLISYEHWSKTKQGSSGKLIDTLECKIDSPDPQNVIGEILLKGENVMYGYYKNEEATKKAIDEDGWLHTGDLGIIDKENYIFIKGRSKSMLLGPSGENIYPEEIEAKLNNMPYIMESLVLSDAEHKLVALVYPDYEEADKEGLKENDLKKIIEHAKTEVNRELPKYMRLSQIRLYPTEFEKTPKRSIKRYIYKINQMT